MDDRAEAVRSEPEWLTALSRPETYPHPVGDIQRMETHISWVFLTGDWAYKLKKPVRFRFVDFTSFEQRHAACLEELRLNRRTAPELYDCVIPLTQTPHGPRWNGDGPVLEYGVRMRQFSQSDLLLVRLREGRLTPVMVQELAIELARFHLQAEVATFDSGYGTPALIRAAVDECFESIRPGELPEPEATTYRLLEDWADHEARRLAPVFEDRLRKGWVRDCHGDLHLGNLVLDQGVPRPFDCLEFNPKLRWVDVISDLAFLVMDLLDHDSSAMAWQVLNGWLEWTGDYEGIAVLRYYLVYRALVRAKVAALRLTQSGVSEDEAGLVCAQRGSYLELARQFCENARPAIVLLHGLSGSGKSYVAAKLASGLGGVRLRSDVERKRLAGIWPPVPESQQTPAQNLYEGDWSERTYERLERLAEIVVESSQIAIVDAASLRADDRHRFLELARRSGVPVAIVDCVAPDQVLRERISARQAEGADPSDATLAVLDWQQGTREPLSERERSLTVTWDTTAAVSDSEFMAAVKRRIDQAIA